VSQQSTAISCEELEGAKFGFNDELSLSGYYLAKYWLSSKNLPYNHVQWIHTNNHRNSINLVLQGTIDAACIDSHVLNLWKLENPINDNKIKIIDSVGPVAAQPFVASSKLSQKIVEKFISAFYSLSHDQIFTELLKKHLVVGFVNPHDSLVTKVEEIMSVVQNCK